MRILLAVIFLSALPVCAQNSDAKTVASLCEKALTAGTQSATCSSYIRGVLDANQLWYAAMTNQHHFSVLAQFYCAPNTLRTKDAAKLFVDWLKQNSKHETDSAANAIVLALREKYPCK
jgi:hypothetical protein